MAVGMRSGDLWRSGADCRCGCCPWYGSWLRRWGGCWHGVLEVGVHSGDHRGRRGDPRGVAIWRGVSGKLGWVSNKAYSGTGVHQLVHRPRRSGSWPGLAGCAETHRNGRGHGRDHVERCSTPLPAVLLATTSTPTANVGQRVSVRVDPSA